ncbi:MAG: hypothetical protein C4583_02320 [Anaerolineaceae bacterium]|nr:MAG: hypothetical protein C4583_02320 [Anaerolineaceae bacterium]
MEPFSLLLDTFIELANRIVNLEKIKREDKQQVFREIIDPLFIQLQPVVFNYLNIFSKAEEDVIEKQNYRILKDQTKDRKSNAKKTNHDYPRTLGEIQTLRKEMLLARSTVKAMARQIRQLYKDEIITEFAERILIFFDVSVCGIALDEFSILLDTDSYSQLKLVRLFEKVMDGQADEFELKEFISEAHDLLERKWVKVVNSYAAAKIHCLSAPNSIKQRK